MVAPPIPLSDRIAGLRPTSINAIQAEMRVCEARGMNLHRLHRGEPDFRTPAHIVDACTSAMAAGRTGYPDNRGEKNYREAISLKLKRDNGLTYDSETEVLATTGATFGIYAALAALLREGDEVLMPDPSYDAYYSPVLLCGGKVRTFRSDIRNGRFGITEEELEAAWSPRIRILIINSPWNPVGTVLNQEELRIIGRFCRKHDVVLFTDEVYETIIFGEAKHLSPLQVVPELRDQTIYINSLSKTYAMTGWRVGYCVGPANLIGAMLLVLAQSSRGPAMFIQDAAAAALAGPQDCTMEMRNEYDRRRTQFVHALQNIPGVRPMAPEGGFFGMVDARELNIPSNDLRRRLLNEHGVAVVHGSVYGPAAEGTLRVSLGSGGDALTKGLDALRNGLIAIGKTI